VAQKEAVSQKIVKMGVLAVVVLIVVHADRNTSRLRFCGVYSLLHRCNNVFIVGMFLMSKKIPFFCF